MASRRDMHDEDGEVPAGPSGPAKGPRRRDPNAGMSQAGKFGGKFGGKSDAKRGGASGGRTSGSTPRAGARPTRLRGPLEDESVRSDRPLQVAGEIRRAVQAEIARGLNDPRVQGLVSVTDVELTPDLSEARIKVSVLPEQKASLTLSGLRAAAGFLRRRVMDETRIGRVPRLVFEVDERFKREAALDTAIRATAAPGSTDASDEVAPATKNGNIEVSNNKEENGKKRTEDKTR